MVRGIIGDMIEVTVLRTKIGYKVVSYFFNSMQKVQMEDNLGILRCERRCRLLFAAERSLEDVALCMSDDCHAASRWESWRWCRGGRHLARCALASPQRHGTQGRAR